MQIKPSLFLRKYELNQIRNQLFLTEEGCCFQDISMIFFQSMMFVLIELARISLEAPFLSDVVDDSKRFC